MTAIAASPRAGAGFTLLELLVVVLLIGLLTSLAVLGVQGRSALERQREEAQRLLARMELAREEAVLRASSLGIRFEPDAYRFLGLDDDKGWQRLRNDRVLRGHKLPSRMRLAVDIDGLEVELAGSKEARSDESASGQDSDSDSDTDDGEQRKPQIFFLAGGEIVPDFSIRLTAEATRTVFVIQPGKTSWLTLKERDL